ncbi:c repressor [Pseudomonas sp. 57B-090624]|uniref:XRE family transcriptional regulator n=1 Tax=Pseudomonas sp. 57B-090624 TaxID=2213080 RepID=UPI000DA99F5F|nr:helix-turn-helix transcriptional regulator [Pseudomonas sp. 57B-090624]PZE13186.1 c repressor [Pseudomonas sp. 57B-090624]
MSEGIAARIRLCADMAGSGDELARLSSIPRRTLEYYLTGQSEPKVSRCVDIAKAVGVDIGWLATGEGEPKPKAQQPAQSGNDLYAYVPLYDARCSAGHGAWNERSQVLVNLSFTHYSLRKKGLAPSDLACLRVDGDSMTGLLEDGDTVMIDLCRNALEGEGVYVVMLDDHLYAKRLQRDFDGSVRIISHNREYREIVVPKERLGELQIIGRVVWAGGWMV